MLSEDVVKYLKQIGFETSQTWRLEPVYTYTRKCPCCNRSSKISIYNDGSFNVFDMRSDTEMLVGYDDIVSQQRFKSQIIGSVEDVNKILCEVFGERLWR